LMKCAYRLIYLVGSFQGNRRLDATETKRNRSQRFVHASTARGNEP
jgi:hypothetical protein